MANTSMSACELQQIADAINASLDQIANILRATISSDGAGGTIQDWQVVHTVPCRLAPEFHTGIWHETLGRETHDQPWLFTLPLGTDITEHDRLQVGTLILVIQQLTTFRSDAVDVRGMARELD